jgi:alanyl-tRNA synthetase
MRRAMRHAHILGASEPLMHRLVPALVAEMGAAYPELVRAQPLIEETLRQEETRFRQTLDKGLRLLDEEVKHLQWKKSKQIDYYLPGEIAFKLYDTYGFPYDLTEDALRAQGLGVDRAGFDSAMAEQKAAARAAWKGSGSKASEDVWFDIVEEAGGTEFIGYIAEEGEGAVVALVNDGARVDRAAAGEEVLIVTNQTPFYAESGGQVGDTGTIGSDNGLHAIVADTSKQLGRLHVHHARIESGEIAVSDTVKLRIDNARRAAIRANHSATHLLHAALRERLGKHVAQKGSLVAPDRLRFDVSHPSAMGPAELAQVEDDVNVQIRANTPVSTRLMTPEEAIAEGAMALFGEKYGDEVRVVSMGSDGGRYSVELCGGTHVAALGDISLFKVVGESAVSSGVRRVEALTGDAARAYLNGRDEKLRAVAAALKSSPEEVPARVAALIEDRRRLERELADAKKALALGGGKSADAQGPEQVGGHGFMGQVIQGLDPKGLRGLVDDAKKRVASGVVALVAVNDGRATVAVGVTDDLTGRRNAVDLVRAAVSALGGQGGGGRPDMAQGGGPDGSKAQDALAAVRSALTADALVA